MEISSRAFQRVLSTSIYLQKLASIQPRTCLSKFAKEKTKVRKEVRANVGGGKPQHRGSAVVGGSTRRRQRVADGQVPAKAEVPKKEKKELCKGVHWVDLGESFQTHRS